MARVGSVVVGGLLSSGTRATRVALVCVFVLTAGACSGSESGDPDAAICEAIASFGPNASSAEASAVAEKLRSTGTPDDELLQGVREHIGSVGNQLTLYIPTFDDLAATCHELGVEVRLPAETQRMDSAG